MKQITAVEWLNEMLRDNHKEVFDGNIWEQAKAMEKEQIIRAHLIARCYDNENSVAEAEQYYKKTFKSE